MVLKNRIAVLFFLCCSFGYSQDAKEILKKLGIQYSAEKPLQYKMNYALFKDFDSKKMEESYNGFFYKNAQNEMYVKIGNTEILNLKKVNLKISHSEKAIEINKPISNYKGDFDLKPLLEMCKIEKCVDLKSCWEITLKTNSFTGLPYSKIILRVSKTYFLQKQVFYYNTPSNFSKDYRKPDAHYPRLEVNFSDFNRNLVKASLLNSESYYTSFRGKIVLSQQLKNYEIVDQRNSSHNN
jgi:hypothetical protein